jgi:hypothetical protein
MNGGDIIAGLIFTTAFVLVDFSSLSDIWLGLSNYRQWPFSFSGMVREKAQSTINDGL